MKQDQQHRYININQAKAILGVTRQWLTRLVAAGEVPGATNIAGHPVFIREEFEPWAKQRVTKRKRRQAANES